MTRASRSSASRLPIAFVVLGAAYVLVAAIGFASQRPLPGSFAAWMPLALGSFWLLVAASLRAAPSELSSIAPAIAVGVGVALVGYGVYGLGVLLPYWPCARARASTFPEGYCASDADIAVGVALVLTGTLAVTTVIVWLRRRSA